MAVSSFGISTFSSLRLTKRAFRTGGFFAVRLTSMVQYSRFSKRADLALALDDQPQRDGLHAAGGKSAPHLVPKQRRNLVSDQPVEHAARLLRLDQVDD